MTVQSTYRRAGPFLGNGVVASFPFEFKVFQKSDVHVVLASPLGVEEDLEIDADFTVALNADQDADPGGTVTYPVSGGTPLPTGWRLTLLSNMPQSQLTDITNAGRFNPDVVERAFDKSVVLIQQLAEQISRAVLVPVSSDTSPGSLIKELVDAAAVAIQAAADAAAAVIDASVLRVDLASTADGKGPALVSFKAALTDSVARVLLDKLTEMASAKDLGATGDNFTLNDTAITRAVAALKLASVPTGSYKMSAGTFGKAGSIVRLEPGARLTSDAGNGALSFADNSGLIGFNEGADGNTWYQGRKFSGAREVGVGPVNGGFSPVAFMYDVRADSSDCGGTFGVGLTSRLIFGGNATKGGRIAFNGTVEQQDGATNPLSLNRNYVGTQGTAYAQGYGTLGGDGGTLGNEKGGYFGLAGAAYVNALARYVFDATGAEFNTFIGTGTVGLKYTSGISVVGVNAERGTVIDCGIRIAGQSGLDGIYTGHIGWTAGITFTDTNGAAPIFTGGSLINTVWAGGGKRTIGRGLDFAGFDITAEVLRSGDYMKLTNDHLWLADNAGFATIEPNGPGVNATLMLRGRGTGLVGIGPWTNMGSDAPANGFIRVCDAAGVERKLLTTA